MFLCTSTGGQLSCWQDTSIAWRAIIKDTKQNFWDVKFSIVPLANEALYQLFANLLRYSNNKIVSYLRDFRIFQSIILYNHFPACAMIQCAKRNKKNSFAAFYTARSTAVSLCSEMVLRLVLKTLKLLCTKIRQLRYISKRSRVSKDTNH